MWKVLPYCCFEMADIERWINAIAADGWKLSSVRGRFFKFQPSAGTEIYCLGDTANMRGEIGSFFPAANIGVFAERVLPPKEREAVFAVAEKARRRHNAVFCIYLAAVLLLSIFIVCRLRHGVDMASRAWIIAAVKTGVLMALSLLMCVKIYLAKKNGTMSALGKTAWYHRFCVLATATVCVLLLCLVLLEFLSIAMLSM